MPNVSLQKTHNFTYVKCASIIVVFLCSIYTSATAAPWQKTTPIDHRTASLLDLIGSVEAPKGYDTYSYYASSPPPKPLTQMTVSEVLAWQDKIDRTSNSEAAGRYQIMEDTLRDYVVPQMGLTGAEMFNPALQNAMAVILMKRRGWNPKSKNYIKMANALALEWAGLPLVSGPNKGKSAHHNTKSARNRAQVMPKVFLDVMINGSTKEAIQKAIRLTRTTRRPTGYSNITNAFSLINSSYTKLPKKRSVTGGTIKPSRVIIFTTDPFQLE